MTLYIIAYDLHEGKDDADITNAIRQFRMHFQCLKSAWLVITEQAAENVFDLLCPYIIKSDKLLVLPIDTSPDAGAFWANFDNKASDWLKNHM